MKLKFWLILIIILGACLRLYNLSVNPPSLDWDEAATGWNAKTIWQTRRDEYGQLLPLSFKSFGDYKAPVYIYLTAPIVGVLGINPISVRFISVLAGIISIYLIYRLVLSLWPKDERLALIAAALLATSPWHILLSRPAFEPNLALFFILLGSVLYLESKLIFSALSFVLALYTYHSPKLFLPFFLLGLVFIYRKKIIKAASIAFVFLLPLAWQILFGSGASRFNTSIFFNNQGQPIPISLSLIWKIVQNYFIHFSPLFLFQGLSIPRVSLQHFGLLLIIQAPFLILGLYILIKKISSPWSKFLLLWLLTAPIPAMIGREVPHPIRAYQLLIPLTILTALGIKFIIDRFKFTLPIIVIFYLFNLIFFIKEYFITYPIYSAPDWQYGYQQVSQVSKEYEDKVDRIIITPYYGQPYIFTLVYQQRDPQAVFWGAMSKYLYREINWEEDSKTVNNLIIASPTEIDPNDKQVIQLIKFPDGNTAFVIART